MEKKKICCGVLIGALSVGIAGYGLISGAAVNAKPKQLNKMEILPHLSEMDTYYVQNLSHARDVYDFLNNAWLDGKDKNLYPDIDEYGAVAVTERLIIDKNGDAVYKLSDKGKAPFAGWDVWQPDSPDTKNWSNVSGWFETYNAKNVIPEGVLAKSYGLCDEIHKDYINGNETAVEVLPYKTMLKTGKFSKEFIKFCKKACENGLNWGGLTDRTSYMVFYDKNDYINGHDSGRYEKKRISSYESDFDADMGQMPAIYFIEGNISDSDFKEELNDERAIANGKLTVWENGNKLAYLDMPIIHEYSDWVCRPSKKAAKAMKKTLKSMGYKKTDY